MILYPATGDLSATYLLANVWADVARFGQATAYVGGGLGAAYVTADTSFNGSPDWGYGKGEWGFAGQLGAGVTYAIAQNIDLDLGYRFKAVTDIDFDDMNGDEDWLRRRRPVYAQSAARHHGQVLIELPVTLLPARCFPLRAVCI